MPVHRVKGGYKWGEHGKVYPSRAGAERQARAAYAHGYEGKSFDPMEAVMELAGGVYGNKTYLQPGEEPPAGKQAQTGPNGGRFYLHDQAGDRKEATETGGVIRGPKTLEVWDKLSRGRDWSEAPGGHGLTEKQAKWLTDVARREGASDPIRFSDGRRTWEVAQGASGKASVKKIQGGHWTEKRPTGAATTSQERATPESQEDPATAERARATRFDEVPPELVDHINQTVASVRQEPGEPLGSYVDRVLKATVSMHRAGPTREMGAWVHAMGGRDFWESQGNRVRRYGIIKNFILDELERQRNRKMNNSYLSDMVDLAAEASGLVAKAPGYQGRRGPGPQTFERKKTKEEHFAVHEDDSGERVPLPKERYYLKEGEEAPPSVFVQEGPRGGRFYEVQARGKAASEGPAKEGAGSMGVVVDNPEGNPARETKPTPKTSQTVEVEEPFESTIARIREALASAKIPQAEKRPDGRSTPGYEIETRDDNFRVFGRGQTDDEAERVFRLVSRTLENSDLDVMIEDDHVVVEALEGDPMEDLFGDGIDTEIDPILSEKSWSHDEAIAASGLISKGVMPEVVAASMSSSRLLRSVLGK